MVNFFKVRKGILMILLCLIIGFFFSSCVSTSVNKEPTVEIIEVPGLSKDEIYRKANMWAVRTFNSAESVIEYSDKEEGIVSGKSLIRVSSWMGQPIYAPTLTTVEAKDGKCRMSLELVMKPYYVNAYGERQYSGASDEKIDKEYASLIESLRGELNTESANW